MRVAMATSSAIEEPCVAVRHSSGKASHQNLKRKKASQRRPRGRGTKRLLSDTMPGKSSVAAVPQRSPRYPIRVAMKKPNYLFETSESEESKSRSSSDSEKVTPPLVSSSDSEEEAPNEFLKRRAKNIKDNKAMLAKLVAELDKLPGNLQSASTSQNSTTQKYKRRSCDSLPKIEPRRNPERAARRVTRSMGMVLAQTPEKEGKQQSLEGDLLEKRKEITRRRATRSSIVIPHVVRPVEEITEDELNNIADNVKEKIYNTVTNWTCPPCREICNCSFCRQRDGRCATGILFPLARNRGYNNVHSYLTSFEESDEDD
ncbi:cell division cycle-associated protein 7-like isoform 2-T3 [Anomaloglossus baeobatrachus]|uniref:cell division cycle-associated protein 7-like isoform X2 n=1 Tax=Anomaloglossus baeobatrachus TaxID=238106 RepID=UPI003F508E68